MSNSEQTANDLVEEHLYLVQHVVNQLAVRYPRHVDREELWAAGAAGLVDASRRYDPATAVPFARYATIRIRGTIIDSTRSRDWATRGLRRRARELADATRQLEQAEGHVPTTAELAESLGVSEDEVRDRRQATRRATLLQLDQPLNDGDGGVDTLGALLPDEDTSGSPAEATEERELLGNLRVAVEHLGAPHREVVERCYYGGELLQEIATSLGVTEARVSQIRTEALTMMRAWMATQFDGVPEVPERTPGSRRRRAYLATMESHPARDRCLRALDASPVTAQTA